MCLSCAPSGEPLAGAQTVGNSRAWPFLGLPWGADREQQEAHLCTGGREILLGELISHPAQKPSA